MGLRIQGLWLRTASFGFREECRILAAGARDFRSLAQGQFSDFGISIRRSTGRLVSRNLHPQKARRNKKTL